MRSEARPGKLLLLAYDQHKPGTKTEGPRRRVKRVKAKKTL